MRYLFPKINTYPLTIPLSNIKPYNIHLPSIRQNANVYTEIKINTNNPILM